MRFFHKLVFYKSRRSAYHSFFEVLPPKKYAKDHPDWYSEIDGKRVGSGQLCVTNPEMQREYIKNTLELLRANPDCDMIQVSPKTSGFSAMRARWGFKGSRLAEIAAFRKAIEEFKIDAYRETITRKTLDDYLKSLDALAN